MGERIAYEENGRYRRLILLVGGIGLWFFIGDLILDYLFDYGFTLPHWSKDQVYQRILKGLFRGVWMGFFLGFPMWLVRENFKKRGKKKNEKLSINQKAKPNKSLDTDARLRASHQSLLR